MTVKAPPFDLSFEVLFLESYERLGARERRAVFIAYASVNLRITFEYGPEPGMLALRNCGFHDACESKG